MNKEKLINCLNNNDIDVYAFESIDSTSTYARSILNETKKDFLVAASSQTNGRGRKGNSFVSLNKGCYFTFAHFIDYEVKEEDLITLKVVNAVSKVVDRLFNIPLDIKWVNDLYYHDKKCAGILSEMIRIEDKSALLLGIGINVNPLPEELSSFATYLEIDSSYIEELIGNIVDEFLKEENRNNDEVLKYYASRMMLINKEISFDKDSSHYEAIVRDINEKGNLIVETDMGLMEISSGEVSLKSQYVSSLIKKNSNK